MEFALLGSGSTGNSLALRERGGKELLLLDVGFNLKETKHRLATAGFELNAVTNILITHEHIDHTRGLARVCRELAKIGKRPNVFCSRGTAEILAERLSANFENQLQLNVLPEMSPTRIGDFQVEAFPVPHDAAEAYGYLVKSKNFSVCLASDLGSPTKILENAAAQADALFLEANHETLLLQKDTRRPWHIKRRISSSHGHLSNKQAATLVKRLIETNSCPKLIVFMHLSEDCNNPASIFEHFLPTNFQNTAGKKSAQSKHSFLQNKINSHPLLQLHKVSLICSSQHNVLGAFDCAQLEARSAKHQLNLAF